MRNGRVVAGFSSLEMNRGSFKIFGKFMRDSASRLCLIDFLDHIKMW